MSLLQFVVKVFQHVTVWDKQLAQLLFPLRPRLVDDPRAAQRYLPKKTVYFFHQNTFLQFRRFQHLSHPCVKVPIFLQSIADFRVQIVPAVVSSLRQRKRDDVFPWYRSTWVLAHFQRRVPAFLAADVWKERFLMHCKCRRKKEKKKRGFSTKMDEKSYYFIIFCNLYLLVVYIYYNVIDNRLV